MSSAIDRAFIRAFAKQQHKQQSADATPEAAAEAVADASPHGTMAAEQEPPIMHWRQQDSWHRLEPSQAPSPTRAGAAVHKTAPVTVGVVGNSPSDSPSDSPSSIPLVPQAPHADAPRAAANRPTPPGTKSRAKFRAESPEQVIRRLDAGIVPLPSPHGVEVDTPESPPTSQPTAPEATPLADDAPTAAANVSLLDIADPDIDLADIVPFPQPAPQPKPEPQQSSRQAGVTGSAGASLRVDEAVVDASQGGPTRIATDDAAADETATAEEAVASGEAANEQAVEEPVVSSAAATATATTPSSETGQGNATADVADATQGSEAARPSAGEPSSQQPQTISFSSQGPFVPAWEADQLQWPRISERLYSFEGRFRHTGAQLAAATEDGLRILAVTSTYRGEGRTTIAMNLARAAAESGVRVALVDGDIDNPSLAAAMGVAVEHGWHECVLGGLPLDEAAIASIKDDLTVIPLASNVRRAAITPATPGFEAMLRGLSSHFDLVVVDYGPLGANPANGLQHLVSDAAMLVRDIRCTSSEQALAAVQRLKELGAQSVGIVQNFT